MAGPLRAALRAVARARLLAVADAGRVQRASDDLVPNARKVLHPASSHEHDGVLLEVVADARDVGRDLDARGQADPGDLAEGGVRLLGGYGEDARADAAPLRRTAKSGALRLRSRALAPDPDQLLYGRHGSLVCTRVVVSLERPTKPDQIGPGQKRPKPFLGALQTLDPQLALREPQPKILQIRG